eukprot:3061758-Karenia_brevis.AAC.1
MAEQHINRVKFLGEATQGWIAECLAWILAVVGGVVRDTWVHPHDVTAGAARPVHGHHGEQVSLRDPDNILVQKVHAAIERGVQPQAIVH